MGRLRPLRRRWLAAAALTAAIPLAAVQAVAPVTAAQAAPASAGTQLRDCQTVKIPVSLAPGLPATQRVAAEYCQPYGVHAATIDELVPGATYNGRTYWDPQLGLPGYSFVDRTLAAGRATLAIDRLGTGASSKPAAAVLTVTTSAWVLHQVIRWARQHEGYRHVNVIAHSLGSVVAELEAATWRDPAHLVLTGYLTEPAANFGVVAASLIPVPGRTGYLTTAPGRRAYLFYDRKTSDPAVTGWDEKHKDVVSAAELYSATAALSPSVSARVTAPVYFFVGQMDMPFCQGVRVLNCASTASVVAYERGLFPAAASVGAGSMPDTGHDWALSTTAGDSFAMINNSLLSH